MSNTYTVSFFGHRTVHLPGRVKEELEKIITELLTTKESVTFLVGREGFYDIMCSLIISSIRKKLGSTNATIVHVMPYMRADFRKNPDAYYTYYDAVEICEEAAKAHFKAAIVVRNKRMIDRSDLVVFCVERKEGGAYTAMKYALKQQKEMINVSASLSPI